MEAASEARLSNDQRRWRDGYSGLEVRRSQFLQAAREDWNRAIYYRFEPARSDFEQWSWYWLLCREAAE